MEAAGKPARAVLALLSFRRITITVLITRVLRLSLLLLPFCRSLYKQLYPHVSLESEKEKDALCEVQDGRFIETYKRTNY